MVIDVVGPGRADLIGKVRPVEEVVPENPGRIIALRGVTEAAQEKAVAETKVEWSKNLFQTNGGSFKKAVCSVERRVLEVESPAKEFAA